MIAQATSSPVATMSLPSSLLDVSVESLISAHRYKSAVDSRLLGTAGGPSWAFGGNGSTLIFLPTGDMILLQVKHKNLEAIRLLEQWFAEPDDLGEMFWEEFDKKLKDNRFRIS